MLSEFCSELVYSISNRKQYWTGTNQNIVWHANELNILSNLLSLD